MKEGLNRVMLLGNLGADPELRFTQGGQAVLKLRLATTESFLDKDRTRRERTDWHSVVIWGKQGETLSKFLAKGSSIFVEGRLQTSSYDDRDGQKRYKTEVIANRVIMTGGRGRGPGAEDEAGYSGGGGEYPAAGPAEARGGGDYGRAAGGGAGYPRGGADYPPRGAGRPAPPKEDRPAGRAAPPPAAEPPVDDFDPSGGFNNEDDIPF